MEASLSAPSVFYCRRCLTPSTRPRIVFRDGICNACWWAEERKLIDYGSRAVEFKTVVDQYRRHQAYDCIVPFSGGKDSATIAHKLKFEHGLNPLLVTYGQLLWTDEGRRNFNRVADAGFDILYWRVNQEVSRKLARRFFIERGHPKQHYDAGVNAVPIRVAVDMNIPLVFYAEHGESEYGGLVLDEEHRRTRDLTEVLEHQVGDNAVNWGGKEIFPYVYPSYEDIERVRVKAFYFSYFFRWDIKANADYTKEKIGFEWIQPRSDGSFEGYDSIDDKIDGLDYYMMYIKFGMGRATRMASRLIQRGHMTRDLGLQMVKLYDHESPSRYTREVLDYLQITQTEAMEIIDRHRNEEIWKIWGFAGAGAPLWELRYPPQ